jgi:glucose/arabinose dehydrogenase
MKKLLLLFSGFLLTASVQSQTIALETFASGFNSPVDIAHPVGDARLFVVQQGGSIRILNPNKTVNATPFLTLTNTTILSGGERGLLGLAFHPNYAANGYFYVNYTRAGDGATVIARYSVSTTDPNIANPSSGLVLMTISQPSSNHNGGTLKFGSDGYLYIGMGDGGGAGDTNGYAQNLSMTQTQVAANPSRINLGKMLRIDVNSTFGTLNYGIPPTNPYASQAGKEAIWAYGLRNPWKFSFNRTTGDLWIADVGQNAIEEINKITSPLPTALNFGWRCYEANAVYSNSIGPCPAYASTVAPFSQYLQASGRCSVTGGYSYTGSVNSTFTGNYFFGDYCSGEIAYINSTGTIVWAYDTNILYSLTTFGEDSSGEIYVALSGTIYKLYDPTLSTDDFAKNGLSLYPNPASREIFIKNSSELSISNVKIYDLTGKLVLTSAVENSETPSVKIDTLSSGLYLISVEDLKGNQYKSKLVVE